MGQYWGQTGVTYKLGSELGSNAPNNKRAASSHIDWSRFISGFIGEPAVGFEPTACCLRNALSQFRGVRSFSPTPENLIFAKMPVRSHSGATVRVGVAVGVAVGVVPGQPRAQNRGPEAIWRY
jgi:hypothetical protein